jgi:hypothetical protein
MAVKVIEYVLLKPFAVNVVQLRVIQTFAAAVVDVAIVGDAVIHIVNSV